MNNRVKSLTWQLTTERSFILSLQITSQAESHKFVSSKKEELVSCKSVLWSPPTAPAAHPINRRMNCNDSPRPRAWNCATLADVQLLRSAGAFSFSAQRRCKSWHETEMTHEGSSVKGTPANNVSLQRVFKVEECAVVLYMFSQSG